MATLIRNISGSPVTLPEPYVCILSGQNPGVVVLDDPATVLTKLGGASRINGVLVLSDVPAAGIGSDGGLPPSADLYAKKAGDSFSGQVAFVSGARLATGGAQPAASASTRGLLWVVQGGAGVADSVQVCVKTATDTYAWKAITLAP